MYWRESASGLSTFPYFIGNSIIDMYYVVIAPLIFLGPYWHMTLPQTSYSSYYYVGLGVTFWTSGACYFLSSILPPESTLVAGVFFTLMIGAFVNGVDPPLASVRGTITEYLMSISYTR